MFSHSNHFATSKVVQYLGTLGTISYRLSKFIWIIKYVLNSTATINSNLQLELKYKANRLNIVS